MQLTIEKESLLYEKAYKQIIEKIKPSFTGSSLVQINVSVFKQP
jgi:hypothetical protein